MKKFSSTPLFLFLLPVFFFLVGYTDHGSFLRIPKLLPSYLIIYIILLLSFFIINKFNHSKLQNALLIFYVAGVYLFFGNMKGRFDTLIHFHAYLIFFTFLIGFPVVLYFFVLKKNEQATQKLYAYCNVLMVVLSLTQCILIGINYSKRDKYILKETSLQKIPNNHTPSIHLILWDGYPGFPSLASHFKFDNAGLKTFLKEKNYFVFDTMHSNYFQTYISVNSLFNMQYISYLHEVPLNEYTTVLHELEQINKNALLRFLQTNHYNIYNNSIFELDDQKVLHNDPKFKSSEAIHFNQVFHNRISKDFLWRFAKGKMKFRYAYDKVVMHQHYQNSSTIQNLLSTKRVAPHFSYSHIIMPHEPYYTDSTGVLLDRYIAAKSNNEIMFVNYVKYTNLKIKEIADHINKTEPNSIVIMMSDHGYREYTEPVEINQKFDNLMAVYFPDSNYSSIRQLNSNVNLFRILLNQYFNQQLPLLNDSCIIIDEEKNFIRSAALKK